MSQAAADDLKLIELRAPVLRIALLLPLLAALLLSWFAVRWYVGDTIAEYSTALQDGGFDTARISQRLAPDDPLTHWSVATLLKNSLSLSDLQESLKGFEEAVSLSPNDYRLWVDLGTARSQTGDFAGAEKAFRQAVALAPSYAYPRWYLGNLLIREGQIDNAFGELRKGADTTPELRPQIFNLALHVYGDDIETIKKVIGGNSEARAQLVYYLIGRNRVDDALRVWSSFDRAEKANDPGLSSALTTALVNAKRYSAALQIYHETGGPGASEVETGKITNSGFESNIGDAAQSLFGWQAKSAPPQVQLVLDRSAHHGGERGLKVSLKSTGQLGFNNLSQLIVTEPSTQYRLEFWVKTDDLKSVGTPVIEVVDGADDKVIATSAPAHVGTTDWQPTSLEFKTGPKTEGVTIRTARALCGADALQCAIFGVIWYDDFNLQRVGGNPSTGTTSTTGTAKRPGDK
jgi:tetratricopeptide (TPR) repeat protein